MAGLFKRLTSLAPALGVVTRFEVAVATNPHRDSSEPYRLLLSAWLEAIKPYDRQEPRLFQFHMTSGIPEAACKVFSLLPLNEGSYLAARLVASFSYPAYAETPEPQKAWAFLGSTLDAVVLAPEPLNRSFQERNPVTFEATFHGTPFTAVEANDMLQLLLAWVQANAVRLR